MTAVLAQMVDGVIVHRFDLVHEQTTIGRHPDNNIVVDDVAASSTHAQVVLKSNSDFPAHSEYFIEDCGSTNGTYLNDRSLVGRQRLHHNDLVRIAWNYFKFIDRSEIEQDKTAHMLVTQS